ncbi:MAG: hypothetical protein ABI972_29260 [Acidobacteriota bacterium]
MGLLTVLFAVSAVWGLWTDPRRGKAVRWLTLTGMGGLFFALAGETNLHGMLYALIPMLEKARNPSHAVLLWSVGAAGLAALGVDRLLRREDLEWTKRLFTRAACGTALLLWGFWYAYYAVKDGKVEADSRGVVTGFLALTAMALVSGWVSGGMSRRGIVAGLTAVMLAEMGSGMAYQYPSFDSKWRAKAIDVLPTDSDLVAFLQHQRGLGRFQWNLNNHPHNISDLYGVETDVSYLASVSSNVYRLGPWGARGRRLMGVRYLMAPQADGEWDRLVYTTPDGRNVWENDAVLPRVWTVHEAEGGFSHGDSAREMERGTHDFGRWAFLEGAAPRLEKCAGEDAAYVLRRVSDRVELWSDMACRGMVVMSDTWYPGWVAMVDGKPAELLEVYGALRGVVVGKGTHRVTMVFRPWSVYLGGLLTLLGLVAAWGLGRLGAFRYGSRDS